MAQTKAKDKAGSPGKCAFCGESVAPNAIGKHLEACPKRKLAAGATKLYQLLVEGRDQPQYWMHIEIPADASLYDLDHFLRRTWLECCGHMSAFTIKRETYQSRFGEGWDQEGEEEEEDLEDEEDEEDLEDEDLEDKEDDDELTEGPGEQGMNVTMGEVLSPRQGFNYEYDFGTTTYLRLKVLGVREGAPPKKPVTLLARNEPPEILCESCGKAATVVCGQCMATGKEAWYCRKCSRRHKCDMEGEGFLPVANSPRVGQCGYEGK